MTIGFIGFGGAAYGITKGLKEDGFGDVYFFDPLWNAVPQGDAIRRHAIETGAIFKESIGG